ncbi:MAG: lactate utilization protein [Candidatus Methanoperedens sp.]|nr:lactate utilization protein [Candidatus Methanoperedens sp.]
MRYDALASKDAVKKVMEAVKPRGINPEFVNTKEDALRRLKELIPSDAEINMGLSITLKEIGFIDLLKSGKHPWKNWKDIILAEKDEEKQMELRRRSVLSEYFLGSVHAIAETGEIVIASGSGSQLPAYIYTSNNVIWIAGIQKIVPTIDDAIKRVREYSLPREDARMKKEGYPGSTIGKLLIFEREIDPDRRLTLILVNEKLGF